MVIRLDGADFSADNLGKIYVGILDDFTTAAITASGNSSMTDGQKAALNTFFEDIGAFGTKSTIWSKLDKVYIPLLASDVANAMVNYKTNTADTTPSADYWQLRSRGIVGSFSQRTASWLTYSATNYFINALNFSMLSLATETSNNTNARYLLNYQGSNGSSRFAIHDTLNGAGNRTITLVGISPSGSAGLAGGVMGGADAGFVKNKSLAFSVNSLSTAITSISEDGSVNTFSAPILNNIVTETQSATFQPLCAASYSSTANQLTNNKDTSPIGILIFGKQMSNEELVTLKTAAETLANVFNP